jgi:hypothetical protein
MTIKRLFAHALIAAVLMACASVTALADDRSFSSVVKHIQKNYNGKRQGSFGGISFGRFLVKLIKPAGIKNFKVVMFKSVDYSGIEQPEDVEFHNFVQRSVEPGWQPLVQYSSKRSKQWTYVYTRAEDEDMKFLVVTLQQKQAFVVQVKFSPEKLIAFMNDPKILGLSLKDKTDPPPQPPVSQNPQALAVVGTMCLAITM